MATIQTAGSFCQQALQLNFLTSHEIPAHLHLAWLCFRTKASSLHLEQAVDFAYGGSRRSVLLEMGNLLLFVLRLDGVSVHQAV